MVAQPTPYCLVADYLAWERRQDEKHEYFHGTITRQAGASIAHNLITANCIGMLHQQLRTHSCMVLPSDIRVCTLDRKHYMYPDVTILCGTPRFDDDQHDTMNNPLVIIEVLSPSTESYDRGRKFQAYRLMDTFQEYLLVAQTVMRVEHFTRQNAMMWLMTEYTQPEQIITLASVPCTISLAALYEKVHLPEAEGDPTVLDP